MIEHVAPSTEVIATPDMPQYPILDPYELGPEIIDRRDELPDDIANQLDDADHVIDIVTPEIAPPARRVSALREMARIIETGVPAASLSFEENADVESLQKYIEPHSRDAFEVALRIQNRHPDVLRNTILHFAKTQGITDERYDEDHPVFRQEERGRITLLDRDPNDPIARKFSDKLNWGWPFYGSVDATLTFISAIHEYTTRHDPEFLKTRYEARDRQEYTMHHALNEATDWLLSKIHEADGFVEFRNGSPKGGMDAQAWKDSAFAYVHSDGSRANHRGGIASVEIQALAYDALLDSAELSDRHKDAVFADILKGRAEKLRRQIFEQFWTDSQVDGGYFVLGLDRDPNTDDTRQLDVRTSNMGRLLNSRLLEGDEPHIKHMRDETVRQLFSPEMLAHNGIRTLASDEAAFRPGGYHTGLVWPWDTAYIADGLERHGFIHLAWNLRERIWRTSEETQSFPECVRGGDANTTELNKSEIYVWNTDHKVLHLFEQPPQEVQGWTVSAVLDAKRRYPEYAQFKDQIPINYLEQDILARIA